MQSFVVKKAYRRCLYNSSKTCAPTRGAATWHPEQLPARPATSIQMQNKKLNGKNQRERVERRQY